MDFNPIVIVAAAAAAFFAARMLRGPRIDGAQAREVMEAMNMTLTFNADGTMSMSMTMGETRTEEGTWTVKSAEGDTITVETIEAAEGDEEVEPDEVVMNFTGNDTFAATIMNDTLVFNRQ